MKVYSVESVERQDDWRFFDILAYVFEVPDAEVDKFDCSVCMIRSKTQLEQIRIVLPYSKVRELFKP